MLKIISENKTRIKTALLLAVSLVAIGLVDSKFVTWLVLGSVMMIALFEAMSLLCISDDKVFAYSGALWVAAYFYPYPQDLVFVAFVILGSYLAYTQKLNRKLFIPFLYPVVPFLFMFALYGQFGMQSIGWLIIIVASTDTFAYFVGKRYGSTYFCETSPNKTLEGVAGGVLGAVVLGTIFTPFENINIFIIVLITLIVSISSVFGDLYESFLKREAGVKDSGNILPGHGGILDRSDGYLFSSIILYVLLKIFT